MATLPKSRRGAVSLVALCLAAALAIALASYITIALRSLAFSDRNFQNNRTRELAETGLEAALFALNNADWTTDGWSDLTDALNTHDPLNPTDTSRVAPQNGAHIHFAFGTAAPFDSDNDASADDRQWATTFSLDQGVTGYVGVVVTNAASSTPTIVSVGMIILPSGEKLTCRLQSPARRASLFPNAIGCTSTSSTRAIRFRDAGLVDSWHGNPTGSARVDYSYSASAANNHLAIITAPTITLQSADVRGYVALPASATVSKTTSAEVYGASSSGWNSTRVSSNHFQPLFTVNTISGGTTYADSDWDNASLATGTYRGTNINLGANEELTITGDVVISLSGTLTLGGTSASGGRIVIRSGASLRIHIQGDLILGSNTSSAMSRGIVNETKDPSKCVIIGSDTGNDTPTIYAEPAGGLYACIYMPFDGITIYSTPFEFYGSIVASTVYFNVTGTTNMPLLHYDLALRDFVVDTTSINTPFLLTALTALSSMP